MRTKTWIVPVALSTALFVYGILTTDGNDIAILWIAIGILGLIFTYMWFMFLRDMWRTRRVLKQGDPGRARVLRMFETGITINDNPMVQLEMEVTPQRGPTYIATSKTVVSRLNPMMYGPGTVVAVKIDRQDPQLVVVDPEGTARGFASGMPQETGINAGIDEKRNAAMSELILESEKIRSQVMVSGKDAVGTILSSWSLDVNVNNMATAMEFLVEVELPGKPTIKVEIKGVVANDNLGKYAIGTRVLLKYDPADPKNRITIVGVV
jgi:phosphate/sulfate permease